MLICFTYFPRLIFNDLCFIFFGDAITLERFIPVVTNCLGEFGFTIFEGGFDEILFFKHIFVLVWLFQELWLTCLPQNLHSTVKIKRPLTYVLFVILFPFLSLEIVGDDTCEVEV